MTSRYQYRFLIELANSIFEDHEANVWWKGAESIAENHWFFFVWISTMEDFLKRFNIALMKNEITFVKDIRIVKEESEPDLMAIKAKGIASIKKLIAPVLVARKYETEPEDGIFELDFTLDDSHQDFVDVELEVDVVFRIKNLPEWVKGVKINATENSDIELI